MKPSGLDLENELGGQPVAAVGKPVLPDAGESEDRSRPDLEIVIARGNIIHTTSRLILLGQFAGSEPSSAWRSVDKAMEGALGRLSKRQAGIGPRGSVDVVPTGRYFIMADHVVFLSLGAISEFYTAPTVLESAFENGVRGLLVCQVDEFVTVLMGDNPPDIQGDEGKIRYGLEHMLRGFLKALSGEKEGAQFRRLTIAETDPGRHRIIERMMEDLRKQGLFSGFALNHEVKILSENLREDISKSQGYRNNSLFLKSLTLRETGLEEISFTLSPCKPRAGLLEETSGGFDEASLSLIYNLAGAALPRPENSGTRNINSQKQLEALSAAVTRLLPDKIKSELAIYNGVTPEGKYPRLVLLNDDRSAAIPWECIRVGNTYPALTNGFSRLFTSAKVKIVETMPPQPTFRVLLLINPTGDLAGAEAEGKELISLYRESVRGATFDVLSGTAATVAALKERLNSNYYHVLHFAGHSGYNIGTADGSSGLQMADGFFTAQDASLLSKTPGVVVFNSCESARIDSSLTIAKAFITAGIGHFIGTFWPVRDEAAEIFCRELYQKLAANVVIGDAIIAARNELARRSMPDWANYIHYGDPEISMFPGAG